jgi:hypothetical protein
MARLNFEVGALVVSGDGRQLGTLKELATDRFKVERKVLPDYWLAMEYVDHAGDGLVQMILTKEGIHAARVDAPPPRTGA